MNYQAHTEIRKNSAPIDILFVHGNMASKHWWYPVLEILEPQFKRAETPGSVVMAELRGHGRSPMPENKNIQVDDIVNDFIAAAKTAGLRKALIVGHSAGGLITALLLARRPDLFKGALMVDPVGPEGLKNVPADIEARYQMMADSRDLTSQIVSATVYGNDPEKEFFKTTIMDDAMETLKNGGVKLVAALTGVNYSAEIATIQQPVRIFYGAHDWVLDDSNARGMAALIEKSELILLPDNGHCMNYESPERLASEITDFLKRYGHTFGV